MELGKIWRKIAEGQRLSQEEKIFLELQGRNVQASNAVIAGIRDGTGSINVDNIRARTGDFELPPTGISVRVYMTSVQSIADNTITTVTFHAKAYDDAFMWNSSDPTIINIKITGKYQIAMRAIFASNASGLRSAGLANSGGTFLALNQVAPVTGGSTSVTVVEEINLSAGQQYRSRVFQDSGGALDLNGCTFSLRLLKKSDAE